MSRNAMPAADTSIPSWAYCVMPLRLILNLIGPETIAAGQALAMPGAWAYPDTEATVPQAAVELR